ncbi:MAG: xanthine dehydrogenase accessory protein XdhC [Qingshengfaniella sp.]
MTLALDRLAAAVAHHGRIARVLVARIAGSAPREAGAAMLIWPGGQEGTIGGGALEWQAAQAAREALASGQNRVDHHALGPSLGQCCGGAVHLVTEIWDAARLAEMPATGPALRRITGDAPVPLTLQQATRQARGEGVLATPLLRHGWLLEMATPPARPLWIWGAGHVGRALIAVLAPLPDLAITWVDTGRGRFPDAIPVGISCLPAARPADLAPHAPPEAEHLILTYSHALDLALCDALLTRGFAHAGLIGSATKWARFQRRLADLGHAPAEIARIACPIGDPALGKSPQAIAISVAAQTLTRAHTGTMPLKLCKQL